MNNELYYDFLFPCLVCYTDSDIINMPMIDKCKDILNESSEKPFYSNCKSTVKTNNNILELKEFNLIRENIINSLSGFCDILNIKKENLKFISSWLNYYEKGQYQDLHTHSDSMISGVFYIKGTNKKDLIFQAPWHFYQAREPEYTKIELKNCHNVEYESVTGRCYLFLSNLMHRTLPSTEERISLSFNISYS